ncbi:MAG: HIT domain-containing protein [Alphaproteobacteria bacterium]|nr:HIT domain-containing protein [Alphaproteobacteria bacterium]
MYLDSRLECDSTFLLTLELSQIRLHHNAAFPWILLIPQRELAVEVIDLTQADQQTLMKEIALSSHVMRDLFHPTKLNVANLGNIVSQLHIHIVARYDKDKAWPGPIWNCGIEESYDDVKQAKRVATLIDTFHTYRKDFNS